MYKNSLKTSAAESLQLNSLRMGFISKTLIGLFLSTLPLSMQINRYYCWHYRVQFKSHPQMNPNFNNTQFPNLLQHDKLLVKMPPLKVVRSQLQDALRYLTQHSLTNSAKWVGELLIGITTESEIQQSFLIKSFIFSNTDPNQQYHQNMGENDPQVETVLLLAKNLFELRQYKKCSNMLKEYKALQPNNQSIIFYYYYSLWMNGLIRKQQEIYQNETTSKPPQHSEIHNLQRDLKQLYNNNQLRDINLYLYGLVLREQERIKQARKVFIECLNEFPYLWSAWIQLCKIIESQDITAVTKQLKDHWLKNFFFSSFCLQKYRNDISIQLNYGILCFFKRSNYVMNQIAHSFYNNQEFDISLEWFQKLIQIDPFRFENMDTYSNILYIKENQGELANLALKEFYNNKYNPETCCVIGNYYSLMGEHLKAIVYFRKALKLDRTCLAAWTLMGHEYLQMKNIPGAIQAYRNAVQIDPKDFRAWYGLGQTYELQNMNNYALYYYSRAVLSRPKDSRMWNAMGCCYDKMGKANEAQKCYVRAENSKDREGIAIHQMAKLYHAMGAGYEQKAVHAFELNLRRMEQEMVNDKQLGQCLLFLSRYYKRIGELDRAVDLARRLSDLQGIDTDQANRLLQELNLVS